MAELLSRYPSLLTALAGVVLIFWPPAPAERERERQARLAELARGASERHFEERRALETYGPKSAGPFRLWGLLLLALSLALLLLPPR